MSDFCTPHLCTTVPEGNAVFKSEIIKDSPDAFVFNRSELKYPPKAEEGEEGEEDEEDEEDEEGEESGPNVCMLAVFCFCLQHPNPEQSPLGLQDGPSLCPGLIHFPVYIYARLPLISLDQNSEDLLTFCIL